MRTPVKLTKTDRVFLELLKVRHRAYSHTNSTLSSLVRRGLITVRVEQQADTYRITATGLDALEEASTRDRSMN